MSMIYFDNNATTFMPQSVISEMLKWINKGNASSSYKAAIASRRMMDNFRALLAKLCGNIDLCLSSELSKCKYQILFTSGASESNCTVLRAVADSYMQITGGPAHFIVSQVEHKSVLSQVHELEDSGKISVTYIAPQVTGHIDPMDVGKAFRKNTALVCIMHANNETGAINDIKKIGEICHERKVAFYSDTVQTFGKVPFNARTCRLDGFAISFHKVHGPPGIGALILKTDFINVYKIRPLIHGTQNYGLRGGTENIPCIGAAFAACKLLSDESDYVMAAKAEIVDAIRAYIPVMEYKKYITIRDHPVKKPYLCAVLISGLKKDYLAGTLLLSMVVIGSRESKPICNGKLKKALEDMGVIISIGSACNTESINASHVITSLPGIDNAIKAGTLRISINKSVASVENIKKFNKIFKTCLYEMYGSYIL